MSDHTEHDIDPVEPDPAPDLADFEAQFADQPDDPGGDDEDSPRGYRFGLDEAEPSAALFPGDTSTLTYEQRHTLNIILKNPFLSATTHPTQWRTLLADPAPIISRLHDHFLVLEVDREREVALKRPVVNPAGDRFPTLFHDSRLSREETVVVIFLRSHYRAERGSGNDRVFVDTSDIYDFAEHMRPQSATEVTGDRRRVTNAIEQIRKSGILLKTREEDRFEISPAIELLLPMNKLEAILADLRAKNGTDSSAPGDEATETAPGADASEPRTLGGNS
jgi:hypothetical protein